MSRGYFMHSIIYRSLLSPDRLNINLISSGVKYPDKGSVFSPHKSNVLAGQYFLLQFTVMLYKHIIHDFITKPDDCN